VAGPAKRDFLVTVAQRFAALAVQGKILKQLIEIGQPIAASRTSS